MLTCLFCSYIHNHITYWLATHSVMEYRSTREYIDSKMLLASLKMSTDLLRSSHGLSIVYITPILNLLYIHLLSYIYHITHLLVSAGPSITVLVSKCLTRVYTVAKLTDSNRRQGWKNIWLSALRSQVKGKSSSAIKFQRVSRSVSQMPHPAINKSGPVFEKMRTLMARPMKMVIITEKGRVSIRTTT
jgi:hypothetical protein